MKVTSDRVKVTSDTVYLCVCVCLRVSFPTCVLCGRGPRFPNVKKCANRISSQNVKGLNNRFGGNYDLGAF